MFIETTRDNFKAISVRSETSDPNRMTYISLLTELVRVVTSGSINIPPLRGRAPLSALPSQYCRIIFRAIIFEDSHIYFSSKFAVWQYAGSPSLLDSLNPSIRSFCFQNPQNGMIGEQAI
jgi:hypothetical protein